MNNAVIYARYSSTGQNEQTIDGQLRICREFAEQKGFNIVKVYNDKARTGTNDNRPDFQQMISDSESGGFQYILVYKFDRFARNRIDSIMYKAQLKKNNGIRVLSATEPVSDDEGGEIYEMFLEWNDEKYSQRLSKRIKDGITTALNSGTFCGGYLIYGYKLTPTDKVGRKGNLHKVEIDDEKGAIVRYVFAEYAKGTSKDKIAQTLNEQGHRYKGKEWKGRYFDGWLVNPKYTGVFNLGDRSCDNIFPPLIDKAVFDECQKLLVKNKHFAKSNKAREPFLLNGKLFCGYCGEYMVADAGNSHTGTTYKYYSCKQVKKHCKCGKLRDNKEYYEQWAVDECIAFLKDPKRINKMVDDLLAHHERKTGESEIKAVESRIAHTKKLIDDTVNTMIVTENIATKRILDKKIAEYSQLVDDLETQKVSLQIERGMPVNRKLIQDFIAEFTDGDPTDKDFQKALIDNLVTAVYVYDDQSVIYFWVGDKDTPITKKDTDNVVSDFGSSTTAVIGSGDRI